MVDVADVPITLGTSGGCLVAGLLMGWLRSVHPRHAALPTGASNFLCDFGLAVDTYLNAEQAPSGGALSSVSLDEDDAAAAQPQLDPSVWKPKADEVPAWAAPSSAPAG